MKPYIHAALLFVPLASAFAQPADFPLLPIYPDAPPVCSPEELKKVVIPNTTIESVAVDERDGAVRVTAIVTHPPASDRVKVWIALPVKNWNGRFRGNGGGGFLTGSADSLRGAVAQGFATAATDGGHDGGSGSFALHASGRLNWQEIRDFAYLGIHEMTVVGKESIEGRDAYWLEFAHTDARSGSLGCAKMLMSKDDFQPHRMIVQQPGQPAMELPM